MSIQTSCLKKDLSSPTGLVKTYLGKGISFIGTSVASVASVFPTLNAPSRISLQDLNESDINVIGRLAKFREALENYNPGIIQDTFADFQQQYKLHQDNVISLKKQHAKALKRFEKIYEKVLQKETSDQKKNAITASFKKFSMVFTALVDSSSLDASEIESLQLIKSENLDKQLSQIVRYLESKKISARPFKDLQKKLSFNRNNPAIYENILKELTGTYKDILETVSDDQQKVEMEGFFAELSFDLSQIAFHLLVEFNETIIGSPQLLAELDKVAAYVEKKHSSIKNAFKALQDLKDQFDRTSQSSTKTTPRIMRSQLLNTVAEACAALELFFSEKTLSNTSTIHKNTQKTILKELEKILSLIKSDSSINQEMRFYSSDNPFFEILKNKLQSLPKENPSLFTKQQKTFLDNFQKDLYAISHGKIFNKNDLQKKLHQCCDIIKETLPDTPFIQATDVLYDLESLAKNKVSIENSKKITNALDSLSSFINDPRVFPPSKVTFENLNSTLSLLDLDAATDCLNSIANTQELFQPNESAFEELKNERSGIQPDFQTELDNLYPLKKAAFKKLKEMLPNQKALDLLNNLIENPDISFQPEEKAKLENLHKKLSSIVPNQILIDSLTKLTDHNNIPCKASPKTFEKLANVIDPSAVFFPEEQTIFSIALGNGSYLYRIENSVFETLQKDLSSVIPDREIFDLLGFLIDYPSIPADQKEALEDLKANLSSLDKIVLDCLYPLEKSVCEDLKSRLSSFRDEVLDFFHNKLALSVEVDARRIEKLRDKLNSIPDLTPEFLDSCINDPNTSEEKKQIFESLKQSLSLITKELDSSDLITQAKIKEKLFSIITLDREILHNLRSIITDPNLSENKKKLFGSLKRHLSSIDLEATALLHYIEQPISKEKFSSIGAQVISDLNLYINDPRIPAREKSILKDFRNNLISIKQDMTTYLHSMEKAEFEGLIEQLSSITPGQNISQQESIDLQAKFNKCRKLIEEIKTRVPLKERNQMAIEQKLQKLTTHATNLSFMMLFDKTLFTKNRDPLFYLTIIEKAEETSKTPKELLFTEWKKEGAPNWKIIAAKVCFFITKHLGIERYVHKTISRIITNYSKLAYQLLDQEYNQDQFYSLIKTILKNATTYFQLLNSAISNAKKNAQIQQPEPLTELIIKELLLLKPQEEEATLKELNLKELYTKLADDIIEKSESRLIKWIASWLNNYKHILISDIIKMGTESLLNPSPRGTASTMNILLRDGLKTLYKKLPSITNEDSSPAINKDLPILLTGEKLDLLTIDGKSKLSEIKKLVDPFVESFIDMLNEHRAIQQLANIKNIIAANEKHIEYLKAQSIPLQGIINPQIGKLEAWNSEANLKLDTLLTSAVTGQARQSFALFPVIKDVFGKVTHPWEMIWGTNKNTPVLPTAEISIDKLKNRIRPIVDDVIREKLTLALTKLLKEPFPEEILYDLFYQVIFLTNQSIEHPKENKETQEDVKREIATLIQDNSFTVSNSVIPSLLREYTGIRQLSEFAERRTPNFIPELISSVLEERFLNITNLTQERALFQPEAMLQLGRRIILPIKTA